MPNFTEFFTLKNIGRFLPLLLLITACQPTPTPEPTPVILVTRHATEHTRFNLDRSDSYAQYAAEETFLEHANVILAEEPKEGLTKTVGRTRAIDGYLEVDFRQDIPQIVGGEFSVDLATLRTNRPKRDETVAVDYLKTNLFPQATFTLFPSELPDTYKEGDSLSFPIFGALTVRGVTQNIELDAIAVYANNTITASASAPLLMSDFGIDPPNLINLFIVEDAFILTVEITAHAE